MAAKKPTQHLLALGGKVFKWLLVGLAVHWLVHSGNLSLDQFLLSGDSIPWLAAGAATTLGSLLLVGLRYWYLLKTSEVYVDLRHTMKVVLVAIFLMYSTIGSVGGDVFRAVCMARAGGNPTAVTGTTILDRAIGLLALLALTLVSLVVGWDNVSTIPVIRTLAFLCSAAIGSLFALLALQALVHCTGRITAMTTGLGMSTIPLAFLLAFSPLEDFGSASMWGDIWLVLPASFALATVFLIILQSPMIPALANSLREKGSWLEKLMDIMEILLIFHKKPKQFLGAFSLATVQQVGFILALYFFSRALVLPASASLVQVCFAAPLAFVLAILPFPAAGIGINEMAFDHLLAMGALGVSGGATIFLFFRAMIIVVSAIGLPFYLLAKKQHPASD